ncbi:MAG: four helix bundle protein [Kiritimatiellaeota bacterium]|nr:four helix bundle protein [Kiritimatiellota bacterium]
MATYYKDLIVWQKAMLLAKLIYRVTQTFPHSEVYGLVSQMRRASVSIPSNIAEGQTRKTPTEFARFLSISHGSLAELETQMIIARDLDYVSQAQADEYTLLHDEVSKMLIALKTKFSKN